MEERLIEFCENRGFVLTEMPLRTRPKARHWHIRRGTLPGTVEVTIEDGDIVIEVRANRHGPWTEEAASSLRNALIS